MGPDVHCGPFMPTRKRVTKKRVRGQTYLTAIKNKENIKKEWSEYCQGSGWVELIIQYPCVWATDSPPELHLERLEQRN